MAPKSVFTQEQKAKIRLSFSKHARELTSTSTLTCLKLSCGQGSSLWAQEGCIGYSKIVPGATPLSWSEISFRPTLETKSSPVRQTDPGLPTLRTCLQRTSGCGQSALRRSEGSSPGPWMVSRSSWRTFLTTCRERMSLLYHVEYQEKGLLYRDQARGETSNSDSEKRTRETSKNS